VEPAWLATLLALIVGSGASRLMAIEWVRRAIANARCVFRPIVTGHFGIVTARFGRT
jgi:hypothetical protein